MSKTSINSTVGRCWCTYLSFRSFDTIVSCVVGLPKLQLHSLLSQHSINLTNWSIKMIQTVYALVFKYIASYTIHDSRCFCPSWRQQCSMLLDLRLWNVETVLSFSVLGSCLEKKRWTTLLYIGMLEHKKCQLAAFFAAFPRMKAWLEWYLSSQKGSIDGSWRWRGRQMEFLPDPFTRRDSIYTKELNPKTLTSGNVTPLLSIWAFYVCASVLFVYLHLYISSIKPTSSLVSVHTVQVNGFGFACQDEQSPLLLLFDYMSHKRLLIHEPENYPMNRTI